MRRVLIAVSYGSPNEARLMEDIGLVEGAVRAAFPDWELLRAFTSGLMRRKMGEQGIPVFSASEAVAYARSQGAERILLASLLISPGGEHDLLCAGVPGLPVTTPLLAGDADLTRVAALAGRMQALCGTPLVLMGHGNAQRDNAAYMRLKERLPAGVSLACLEGTGSLSQLLPRLLAQPQRHITLLPLLMSVGAHTLRDMAGDGPESWRSRLVQAGFQVDCLCQGLGRQPDVQQIFVDKIRRLISSAA